MSAALAASKILKKMAREGSDADDAEEMRELANHYEKHAIGITHHNMAELTVIVTGLEFILRLCICVSQVSSPSATTVTSRALRNCWFACHTCGAERHACGWHSRQMTKTS